MKVLVICQHYWPEPYPLEDVCEEMVRRGHEVHVVTGVPNYPMGRIYSDYTHNKNREQIHNGVHIKRTFTIGRRKGIFFRILNYLSYAISSCLYVNKLKEEFDVVFTNQTSPITMSLAAKVYARKHGVKSLMYCMDLWPASLAVVGIGKQSLVYHILHYVSKKIYRGMDKIMISSEMFRSYLKSEFGIEDEKIVYRPQYSNSENADIPVKEDSKDTVDLLFAGNIGFAQSIQTILSAADLLRDREYLRWHVVGDGAALEQMENKAQILKLENVYFHGRVPSEKMHDFYAKADALLVTLVEDENISMTLPGKIQSYMAAGKPIIAAANGEVPRVVNQAGCGYCAEAENAAELADAVLRFINDENWNELGKNAREYYMEHFSRNPFMDEIEGELYALCEKTGKTNCLYA